MARRETSRERLVDAGAEIFGRQGFHGTGVKQIVDAARAPFASLYHFFPGGKEELGAEAVRRSGAMYAALVMSRIPTDTDAVDGTLVMFARAAENVRDSGYEDACPIATVALEMSSTSEAVRLACGDVFESWFEGMIAWFVSDGVPDHLARPLAIQWLSLLEGAFIFCRAARSTEALDVAAAAAAALVHAAKAQHRTS